MRLLSALLICLVLVGQPALAQNRKPATPSDPLEAARAEADRLIAGSGAAELFENVTDGISPAVRHLRSGLLCTFEPGVALNKVMLFDSSAAYGDDVGCNTEMGGIAITHYATRYAEPLGPDFLAEDAGRAIKDRWPNAEVYSGMTMTMSGEGLPATSAVRFVIGGGEKRGYTHALTAEVNGWSFKQRLTAPLDRADEGQLLGQVFWATTLQAAKDKPGTI